jgi:isopentenyl-diphosphate delta-isomerase
MEEVFEIFDAHGRRLGTAPRSQVHREGLWHRAANVFLLDRYGRLWLQRRSSTKDVWPGAWDLSVAEHLQPDETYLEAAARGLHEEMNVPGVALEPLEDVVACRTRAAGINDYELQQSFVGIYDRPLSPSHSEVAAVRSISLEDLAREISERPEAFTPWLRQRLGQLTRRLAQRQLPKLGPRTP